MNKRLKVAAFVSVVRLDALNFSARAQATVWFLFPPSLYQEVLRIYIKKVGFVMRHSFCLVEGGHPPHSMSKEME